MAEALKQMYSPEFADKLSAMLSEVYPSFDAARFREKLFDRQWEERELKQRMRHISVCLYETLQLDYAGALGVLQRIAPRCRGFEYMFLPDFVEVYGLDHWVLSIPALELFTQSSSSEFAVRPFIKKDPQRMMAVMLNWAKHDNVHVRRLASEGCRPRLPWAMALDNFKADPSPILPVLELLNNDESEYVRKSVANNLNDISKDHPDRVIDIARNWYGRSKNTDWIVKHGCRSLLKKGNRQALALFGYAYAEGVEAADLTLSSASVPIGGDLHFRFRITNQSNFTQNIRLEYAIDYVKSRGDLSRKVFKISESVQPPGGREVARTHHFRDLTTRKHYAGVHRLTILVNGKESVTCNFHVIPAAVK